MKPQEASCKFRDYMRLKHLAWSTEQSYLAWLARYMRFLGQMRAIQQAMGHKSLETTMGYLHAEALRVRSPLEEVTV